MSNDEADRYVSRMLRCNQRGGTFEVTVGLGSVASVEEAFHRAGCQVEAVPDRLGRLKVVQSLTPQEDPAAEAVGLGMVQRILRHVRSQGMTNEAAAQFLEASHEEIRLVRLGKHSSLRPERARQMFERLDGPSGGAPSEMRVPHPESP